MQARPAGWLKFDSLANLRRVCEWQLAGSCWRKANGGLKFANKESSVHLATSGDDESTLVGSLVAAVAPTWLLLRRRRQLCLPLHVGELHALPSSLMKVLIPCWLVESQQGSLQTELGARRPRLSGRPTESAHLKGVCAGANKRRASTTAATREEARASLAKPPRLLLLLAARCSLVNGKQQSRPKAQSSFVPTALAFWPPVGRLIPKDCERRSIW